MLKRGNEEERAQREAEKERQRQEKATALRDKQAQAARERFLASPVGRAQTARDAGAGFFQIDMPVSELSRRTSSAGY